MSYELTHLDKEAAQPLKSADELVGDFSFTSSASVRSDEQVAQMLKNPGFGSEFSDYMAHATWRAGEGWTDKVIEPYGALSLEPAAAVLHYGQEIFEGLKAYRHDDGSIWTFRPTYNAARLNKSNRRMAIPELPIEDFVSSLVNLVRADERYVPSGEGSSLYLRPFIFASEPFLGVRAARQYEYLVIASPSGPYFTNGFQPINVWVETEYHRAGPGGMGDAKTGGNYAASLLPKVVAHDQGFDEVMFLDAATNTNIDELGGMNVFVVMADGSVKTPQLNGNILPGGTRSSILQLLDSRGVRTSEELIRYDELIDGIRTGDVAELFACGTAAVVTPIGSLTGADFKVEIPSGPVTQSIYDELTAIQLGHVEDKFNWLYRLV
ncbi:MAG: branched-chain amino acid aminotransferase [Actinomycetaceae bacterium]|nr:branched-chain amino acid aminotransferase [Actinomycetaceae bacterium]